LLLLLLLLELGVVVLEMPAVVQRRAFR